MKRILVGLLCAAGVAAGISYADTLITGSSPGLLPASTCSGGNQFLNWNGSAYTCGTAAGGGASTLAVGTGLSGGFVTVVTSPTPLAADNSLDFSQSLQGGSTNFRSLATTIQSTHTLTAPITFTNNVSMTSMSVTGPVAVTLSSGSFPDVITSSGIFNLFSTQNPLSLVNNASPESNEANALNIRWKTGINGTTTQAATIYGKFENTSGAVNALADGLGGYFWARDTAGKNGVLEGVSGRVTGQGTAPIYEAVNGVAQWAATNGLQSGTTSSIFGAEFGVQITSANGAGISTGTVATLVLDVKTGGGSTGHTFAIASNDTDPSYMNGQLTINSTGTQVGATLNCNGLVSGGNSNYPGGGCLNIVPSPNSGTTADGLLLDYSGVTDSQNGVRPMHMVLGTNFNDPGIMVEKLGNQSNPGLQIRAASQAGIELLDTSLDQNGAAPAGKYKIVTCGASDCLTIGGRDNTNGSFAHEIDFYREGSTASYSNSGDANIIIKSTAAFGWTNYSGSHAFLIRPNDTMSATYVNTLPPDYGTSGQFLQTNGAGAWSWATAAGGGGSTNGTINAANQFSLPYYSLNGSTTALSAFPGVTISTNNGITALSTFTVTTASFSVTNSAVLISTALPTGYLVNGPLNIYNTNTGAGDWYVPVNFVSGAAGQVGNEFGWKGGNTPVGFFWASNGSVWARMNAALGNSSFVMTDSAQGIITSNTAGSSLTVNASVLLGNAAGATVTISSNTVLPGATFYNNANPVFNGLTVNGGGPVLLGAAGNQVTISSNAVMPGATFYQGGPVNLGSTGVLVQISSNAVLPGATFYNNAQGIIGSGVLVSSLSISGITTAFSGCSGTQYLGFDGACHTAAAGGGQSGVAFSTGTQGAAGGYTGTVTSTNTNLVVFDQAVFAGTPQGGSTFYATINTISRTITHTSSLTVTAAVLLGNGSGNTVTISSNTVLPGATFYNGGNINFGAQSSTHTILGNTNLGGGLYLSSATTSGTGGIISSAYTTRCDDSVIFASAPVTGSLTITLEPAGKCSTAAGINQHVLQVTKVNFSSSPVIVVPSGSDLINGATFFQLDAKGQTGEIVTDGGASWYPHGQGIQPTPQGIYHHQWYIRDSFNVTTSSGAVFCPFDTTVPVIIKGYAWDASNAATNGQIAVGISDRNGQILTSTSTAIVAGNQVWLTPLYTLPPGAYNLVTQISTLNAAIQGLADTDNQLPGVSWDNTLTSMGLVSRPLPAPGGSYPKCPGITILTVGGSRSTYN